MTHPLHEAVNPHSFLFATIIGKLETALYPSQLKEIMTGTIAAYASWADFDADWPAQWCDKSRENALHVRIGDQIFVPLRALLW